MSKKRFPASTFPYWFRETLISGCPPQWRRIFFTWVTHVCDVISEQRIRRQNTHGICTTEDYSVSRLIIKSLFSNRISKLQIIIIVYLNFSFIFSEFCCRNAFHYISYKPKARDKNGSVLADVVNFYVNKGALFVWKLKWHISLNSWKKKKKKKKKLHKERGRSL